jgi:endonuclease/exonuclease/phosphatase family metal-dependent hydrolase
MNRLLLSFIIFATIVMGCKADPNKQNETSALNIMTFNIRYDNPGDNANNWKFRRDYVYSMILQNDIDVMGTQEVLSTQLTDLLGGLPQFGYAGVGRKDGIAAGEYSAVFYKKSRFELLKSGTFWLSENPSAVGVKGWDAAIERIVTWVILKERSTGKEFAFINTHFDHMGQVARRESAKLLLNKVTEIGKGLPVLVTGDFNATPDSEVIQLLVDTNNPNRLTDSRSVAPMVLGPAWTFHGFGTVPLEIRTIIDYILIKNKVTIQQLKVISEMKDQIYLSDHNPIMIKATF